MTGQDLISLGIPRGNVLLAADTARLRNAQLDDAHRRQGASFGAVKQLLDAWDSAVKRGLRLEATGLRYEETKRFRKRRFKPQGATGKQRLPVGTPIGPASTGRRCLPVAPEG